MIDLTEEACRLNDHGERVIRPPMEAIKSGKVFKPARAFIYKGWLAAILAAVVFWLLAMLCWVGIAYIVIVIDDGIPFSGFVSYFNDWWMPVNFWWWVVNAFWLIPAVPFWYLYARRIEYSVIA
ncbi:MAG: hypothetical protein ACXADS_16270, partial [Candidatus Thorarchaeota archaeon]